MNKLSLEQTELLMEDSLSSVSVESKNTLQPGELNKIISSARQDQAEVMANIVQSALKAIGKFFNSVQAGMQAAAKYENLSRLSDADLADIGLKRDEIASTIFADSTSRASNAEMTALGYSTKVEAPMNDWDHRSVA